MMLRVQRHAYDPKLASNVKTFNATPVRRQWYAKRSARAKSIVASVATIERPVTSTGSDAADALTSSDNELEDPWEDPKWARYKWTVYRGQAYDLTSFMDRHPAGNSLLNLSIGRDSTALFESNHLRPEVATVRLQMLPVLEGFPLAAVPLSPRPNDSPLYNTIRERVRREVFHGQESSGAHRRGSERAALVILSCAAMAYAAYVTAPSVLTGLLLGLTGAWIGMTVQHCGNHGAMSTNSAVNKALGLCSDLVGGSSLMWRYHHQVSHHIHCNDEALDEDVFSAFPALRFDPRLPRYWFHRFQHLYMWAAFPLMQVAFQVGDVTGLLSNRTEGATLYGATPLERASVVLGKAAYATLIVGLPVALHGWASTLAAAAAYLASQSVVLATIFAVSHSVPEAKPMYEGAEELARQADDNLTQPYDSRDWGVQTVLTAANWGGPVANFLTGGLNLQTEHHMFPAISFMHYPAISKIVRDECNKQGIHYAYYATFPEIFARFHKYMKDMGSARQVPKVYGGLSPAEVELRKNAITKF